MSEIAKVQRKLPVLDAIRYDGNVNDVVRWMGEHGLDDGNSGLACTVNMRLLVPYGGGCVNADVGDWVVHDPEAVHAFFALDAEEFDAKYVVVDEP